MNQQIDFKQIIRLVIHRITYKKELKETKYSSEYLFISILIKIYKKPGISHMLKIEK